MKKKQDWFKSFEGQRWKFDLRRRAEENQRVQEFGGLKSPIDIFVQTKWWKQKKEGWGERAKVDMDLVRRSINTTPTMRIVRVFTCISWITHTIVLHSYGVGEGMGVRVLLHTHIYGLVCEHLDSGRIPWLCINEQLSKHSNGSKIRNIWLLWDS